MQLINAFQTYLELEGRSKNTVQTYARVARWFVEFLNSRGKSIEDIDQNDTLIFLAELKSRGVDINSIRLYANALNKFLKFLGKNFRVPVPKVKRELPKFITEEELKRMIDAACSTRDKLIIMLLSLCGLRVSELVSLKVEDIILDDKILIIRRGKGGKERRIALPDILIAYLRKYLQESNLKAKDYLFTGKNRNHLSVRQVQRIVSRIAKRAGIERKVTPHVLRHTCATLLLKYGTDIRIIQEVLGHSSLRTTQIYTHVLPLQLRAAAETFDKILGSKKER